MQPKTRQCQNCHSYNTKPLYCRTKKGFDRFKCSNCNKSFSENTGKFFFKARLPIWIIKAFILLCLFVRAKHAELIMFILFGVRITPKTMLGWTNKFLNNIPKVYPQINIKEKLYLILHADEKFIKINGKWHYWWSLIDNSGNLITCFISKSRDLRSAKAFFKNAKLVLNCEVDFLVTDKLKSYIRAKNIFGRKCKHIQTGIKGKFVNPENKLFWINNNPAENLNSEIDIFLSRFRYNFRSLESAERWMKCFMFRNYLLRLFEKQCSSEAGSKADISVRRVIMEPIASLNGESC